MSSIVANSIRMSRQRRQNEKVETSETLLPTHTRTHTEQKRFMMTDALGVVNPLPDVKQQKRLFISFISARVCITRCARPIRCEVEEQTICLE